MNDNNNFNEETESVPQDGFAPENTADVPSENIGQEYPDVKDLYSQADAFSAEKEKAEEISPAQNVYTPDEYKPASTENTQPQMPSATYNPYVANASSNQQTYYYTPGSYQPTPSQPPVQQTLSQQIPAEPPAKKGGSMLMWVLIAICVIIAVSGVVIGIMGYSPDDTDSSASSQNETTSAVDSDADNDNGSDNSGSVGDSMDVSPSTPSTDVPNSVYVAEKVRPSVVGVMTYYNGKLYGEGSGVLMSEKDGWTYVVTCAHVISEEGVEYGILLLDGTTISAEMVAYDERTDIGVIKVNKTGLPLAEFGDSTTLKVGEPIYAIGNPGGSEYFGSITDGIVAAIDRSVTSTYTMTCIQHNAAINPGNSGGALVNAAGQIIGINSSKIASTEFEGMGFAVPTSIASPVVDALINYGYVPNRPKLGIEYAPVSSYQLYSLIVSIKGLPQGSLVIAGISEDSSLIGTDVQEGDLIIGVNGKDMDDSSVLLDLIETGAVGDSLTLKICRIDSRSYKTTEFEVTITLVEDKGSTSASEQEEEPTTQKQSDFFGDYFGW